MKDMKIGIQLYTVREPLTQDFKGVCRELVKLGFEGAEFAGNYGGMEPAELAAFCKEIGLKACGTHIGINELGDPANKAYEYARALKVKYVTCSYGGDFTQVWKTCSDLCGKAGAAAAKNGFTFTYHNHAAELAKVDGECALDLIFKNNDAKKVMAELDVYWLTKGEQNPVDYIKRYSSRLPELHMKDMNPEDSSFTELGTGRVDLAACVAAAKESICEWVIYEQDVCKRPQLESAEMSIKHLKKLLGR